VKPMLPIRLPRLYVSILIYAILFTALNILIIIYGRNLFIYFQAIWSWAGVLLMAMIGAMLIGMVVSGCWRTGSSPPSRGR
jgi:predicted permease